MRSSIIAPILALAVSVAAIQVTFPDKANAELDFSKENTLTWTKVVGDAEEFRVELVNNVVNPPTTVVIKDKVETKDEKYTIKPLAVKTGSGYQINLVNTKSTGILAQSQQFTIEKAAKNETSSTPSPTQSQAEQTNPATAATPTKSGSAANNLKAWGGVGALAAFVAMLV